MSTSVSASGSSNVSSTSSSSSSSSSIPLAYPVDGTAGDEPPRPQADSLPPKVGEINYVYSTGQPSPRVATNVITNDTLVGPHPAESSAQLPLHASQVTDRPEPTASVRSKTSLVKFLRDPRPIPTLHGVRMPTLIRLIFLFLSLVGTVVSWAVTITVLAHKQHRRAGTSDASESSGSSSMKMTDGAIQSSLIFIHTAFGIITLALILLLERAIFIVRAERYNYLNNPSQVSGRSSPLGGGNATMGFAPWNRPPLPTYASALDYRGTGDVEDQMLAAPPPPEYGNTRGSTLLLSNNLPRALIEQSRTERPLSYRSHIESDENAAGGIGVGGVADALATLELGRADRPSIPPPAVLR